MSNVASLELCKELFEISGWDEYEQAEVDDRANVISYNYTLGFLLRKLPAILTDEDNKVYLSINAAAEGFWCARYADAAGNRMNIEKFYAKTPADALCKLAIELYKQSILK